MNAFDRTTVEDGGRVKEDGRLEEELKKRDPKVSCVFELDCLNKRSALRWS